jgi:hypothetical protein
MARREVTSRRKCRDESCPAVQTWFYASQREADESARYYVQHPYACPKHSTPDENVTGDRPATHIVYVAHGPHGIRREAGWYPEGDDVHWTKYLSGPGFKAFADDFPAGTRLTVTVTAELPATAEQVTR